MYTCSLRPGTWATKYDCAYLVITNLKKTFLILIDFMSPHAGDKGTKVSLSVLWKQTLKEGSF